MNTRTLWQNAISVARCYSFNVAICEFPQFADDLKKACYLRSIGDDIGMRYRFARTLKTQGVVAAFLSA